MILCVEYFDHATYSSSCTDVLHLCGLLVKTQCSTSVICAAATTGNFNRARICKRSRSPGIESLESITGLLGLKVKKSGSGLLTKEFHQTAPKLQSHRVLYQELNPVCKNLISSLRYRPVSGHRGVGAVCLWHAGRQLRGGHQPHPTDLRGQARASLG